MALFDPSRLYTQLQNTGLQNKDQPLFQLINQMIGAMVAINKLQNASGDSGGSSSTTVISQIIQQLSFGSDSGDGEQGFPGAQGIDGEDGANGMVPYYIAPTEEFIVPEFKQALFAMNIDNEGILTVDGFLIEVDGAGDEDCCNRAFPVIYPDSYESSENGYPPGNPDAAIRSLTNNFLGANSFANFPVDLLIGQLKFPATANPSADVNTLDDYEEGSWTPVIGGETSQTGQTYSVQVARYTKIGSMVFVWGFAQLSNAGTITGNVVVRGLPFVIQNVTNAYSTFDLKFWSLASLSTVVGGLLQANTSLALMYTLPAAAFANNTRLAPADIANSTQMIFSALYQSGA